MAVDVCSEISSPRISFSHDLKELDSVPIESPHSRSDALLLNPSIDFDICIDRSFPQEISSADELFANGRILPVEIKKINPPTKQIHHTKPRKNNEFGDENTKKKRLIEFLSTSFEEEEKPTTTKAFWQFRRSSSVNISAGNGLIGRSLQFLTRSNSTGSVPNQKPKVMQKQHSLKENRRNSSAQYYPYNNNSSNSKMPFLRKSNSRSSYGGNGVGIINPVLNITPTYIAKGTVSLFGIGSFFCSKNKSKKKRK